MTSGEQFKALNELIAKNHATLMGKIDASSTDMIKKLDAHKKEMNQILTTKFQECDKKIDAAKSNADLAHTRIDDSIEIDKRRLNLRLDGVAPSNKDEQAIIKLCNILGYADSSSIYQHFRPNSNGAASTRLVLKFHSEVLKEDFFSRYLKIAKTLTLDKLCSGTKKDRVYISHDLCKSQYEVFKLAIKMKQNEKVVQVRIDHGYAMVKLDDNSPFKRFANSKLLEDATNN